MAQGQKRHTRLVQMQSRTRVEPFALAPRPRGTPAGAWLCATLRADIQGGRLAPGSRLPSSRHLARLASMARGTVVTALEQLEAEGYVDARSRSGVFVAERRPPAAIARPSRSTAIRLVPDVASLEPFVRLVPSPRRAFVTNVPAVDLFPAGVWARLAGRSARRASVRDLTGCGVLGFAPLRAAVADYLRRSRGVVCTPEQVVIVSGVQEALALATRLLVGRGHRVVMEDPGYPGALRAFDAAGARVQFLPVDEAGMRVPDRRSTARLVYVTPAHQFPLGVSMSYVRRMALLQWAREAGALIVEDDYDSEYRYSSRPLPALQGLDAYGTVLFTGSFNKLLFPSLRLGYLVVPPTLVDPLAAVLSVSGQHRPMLDQATLCEFMAEGYLFRHLRRMRSVYAARRAALVEAVDRELAGLVALSHSEAGLQAFARLLVPIASATVAEAAASDAVQVAPLSRYLQKPRAIDGLIMGFAAVDEDEIAIGVARLGRTFDRLLRRRR